MFLDISQNSQENTCARISACNFLKKETLAQVSSCEFCKIFKNTFYYRTPLVAASGGLYLIEISSLICRACQWTGFYMIGTFVIRSSHQEVFCKKAGQNNFSKFTEKHLRWILLDQTFFHGVQLLFL